MNKNLLASILIIVGIGIYFTITSPMIDDAKLVKVKNDQLTSAVNNAEEIIKSRNDITRKYNSISEKDRAKLDKMIPSAVDNIRLVIDLNNLALKNHFSLSDVKAFVPSGPGSVLGAQGDKKGASTAVTPTSAGPLGTGPHLSEPILDRVNVSFRATATYQQFMDFMKDMEANLRLMELTKLSIRATDGANYDYEVAFDTFWLRQ